MNKKIRNIMLYGIVLIVILASFKIPEILLEMQENNSEIAVYEKKDLKSSIEMEAEEIYLIKAVHDIRSQKFDVIISSGIVEIKSQSSPSKDTLLKEIENEMKKLKDNQILKELKIDNWDNQKIDVVRKIFQGDGSVFYNVYSVTLKIGNYEYEIDIEEKTKKILNISIEMDNLNNSISKEEIMKNYINYLELNIINDWHLENSMMRSTKKDLVITLIEAKNKYILSLV